MYLQKLIIVNYRSCKILQLELKDNDPNIFIGLNDCGKSTILQAIDLLLGEKPKYNSLQEGNNKSDLSNSKLSLEDFNKLLAENNLPDGLEYNENETIILGKLVYNEEELERIQSLEISTNLSWSLENNSDLELWISKNFDGNTVSTYISTFDSSGKDELWSKTSTDLNKILREHSVSSEDISNENGKGRFSNLEKLRAFYNKVELSKVWSLYKPAKNDTEILPVFKYFDWNCSFEDINNLAGSLMKEYIDPFISDIKNSAISKALEAEMKINEKFAELKDTIAEVAPEIETIETRVFFDVKEKISDIMVRKFSSDGLIHLENQGEGLKRKIWFSLIKSKAKTVTEQNFKEFIWAFDEPETHLYPGAQREFFDILHSLSKSNVQVFVSTHSTIFIDKSKIDNIKSIAKDQSGYSYSDQCENIDSVFSSLNVKNSDFLFFDKFLVVEGDTEQYLIPELYKLYFGKTILEDNIQLINIGGKDKWQENKKIIDNVMKGFQKTEDKIVYLFDNDMSYEIGEAAKSPSMFFVGMQDIEDSIETQIWYDNINEFYNKEIVTVAEIESIKRDIPNVKCNSNEKFYKKLKAKIRQNYITTNGEADSLKLIPDKGKDSAEFILKNFKQKNQIPSKIIEAFKKLSE